MGIWAPSWAFREGLRRGDTVRSGDVKYFTSPQSTGVPQRDAVLPLMAAMGIRFVPLDSDWAWAEKAYGVMGTPAAFLIDQEGRIMFRPEVHDAETRMVLERQVEALLTRSK